MAIDSATCTTTRAPCRPGRRRPDATPRPPAFIICCTGVDVARSAGVRPNASVVTTTIAMANPSTRQSVGRFTKRRSCPVLSDATSSAAEHAGHDDPRRRADDGQQQALGQQLADDAPARGPGRQAHADLQLARAGPGEHEVRQVDARRQQDEARQAEQEPQRGRVLGAQRGGAAGARHRFELEGEVLGDRLGIEPVAQRLLEEARRDGAQLRGGALGRPPGTQPSHDGEPPHVRLVDQAGVRARGRRPRRSGWPRRTICPTSTPWNVAGVTPMMSKRWSVELDLPADHRRVAAVLALPERVADHRRRWPRIHGGRPRRVEHAAAGGRHAQHLEEVAADRQALGAADLAARRKAEALRRPGQDAGEGLLARPDLLPLRVGQLGIAAEEVAVPGSAASRCALPRAARDGSPAARAGARRRSPGRWPCWRRSRASARARQRP